MLTTTSEAEMNRAETAPDNRRDFMFSGYSFIREPLNLCAAGQRWFRGVYERERHGEGTSNGLVLGATPWLGRLLCQLERHVTCVDMSAAMLQLSRNLFSDHPEAGLEPPELIQANWLEMPSFDTSLSNVVGDNSFSYLTYPDGWRRFCDELADRMEPRAALITRLCSVPYKHCHQSIDQIIDQYVENDSINYTEVRAALLFAHWNCSTYEIDTERVLDVFEANEAKFARLFARFPVTLDNDLLTIRKYRGANARYFAPPLPNILDVVGRRFCVTAVHFGPYALSEYFPLLVAHRR
jgi:hypothetical protein